MRVFVCGAAPSKPCPRKTPRVCAPRPGVLCPRNPDTQTPKGFPMKRSLFASALLFIVTLVALPAAAHADSLFLQSITPANGNVFYKYDLILDTPGTLTFDDGQGIMVTGLFG